MPSQPGLMVRLISLAYGLPLAYKGTKWRETLRCTEFETATLDGMPTFKLVGGTYRGTPSETSYVYLFCAYEFIWSVIYCAASAQVVAAMRYYILSRRRLPCSCSPNTASGYPVPWYRCATTNDRTYYIDAQRAAKSQTSQHLSKLHYTFNTTSMLNFCQLSVSGRLI